jgi:hypothetical protein
MATPRITMRKLRDILRLRLSSGLSIRQIQAVTKASIGLVQKLIRRQLPWPVVLPHLKIKLTEIRRLVRLINHNLPDLQLLWFQFQTDLQP